jgi:cobalt-zinc-cadmium efflux system protein
VLRLALALTLGFAVVEALAGWWSGSLALLGDAGHMASDSVALGLAAFAAWVGQRPPSARHSYGLLRAEVLVALLNGLLMLVLVTAIVVEAIRRFQDPRPVAGAAVMGVAFVGLIVNLGVAVLLSRGERSLNVRAALLHVFGDLLASIAALLAGAVITFTGWTPIDPILSLVICALILYSTLRLLREALHVLMEGVPAGIDLERVGRRMAQAPGVVSVHDLHIWTVASGMPALSAHIVLRDIRDWHAVLEGLRTLLRNEYAIEHVTLQPEVPASQTLRRMRRAPRRPG